MTKLNFCVGVVVVASLTTGCGLISSDVTNFDLTLPDKSFAIDAASWQVDQAQADALLMQDCASSPTICASAAQAACAMDCTGRCGAQATCELDLDVGLYQMVDLLNEKPELQAINDEPVIKVTIDSVTYEVPANTLNLATPEMTIYVAPMSVMDPSDPLARLVGTIAPVPAGMTTAEPQDIMFSPNGRAELVTIMSTFKTPFNVLVGSTLTLDASTPAPVGRLDAVLHIKGHAGL